jgi:uncharacterized protein with GYD domain
MEPIHYRLRGTAHTLTGWGKVHSDWTLGVDDQVVGIPYPKPSSVVTLAPSGAPGRGPSAGTRVTGGERRMPTYISLINWTDQGISSFKETVARAKAAEELAQRMGGSITAIYWTVGAYDIVSIGEFPDDETGTAFLLALGSGGNLRTATLRAYNADEMTGIIGKLG